MFPDYNSYSQYYGFNDPFNSTPFGSGGFDYRSMVNTNNDEVINLSQAVELIRKSMNDEREDEIFYESLIQEAPTEREKEIITSIRDDERKHGQILREVYFNLTGQMIPTNDAMGNNNMNSNSNNSSNNCNNQEEANMSYQNKLEKALFGELDAVIKYRRILGTMPSGDCYVLIMSIMTDELRHSAMYNYLIHKTG